MARDTQIPFAFHAPIQGYIQATETHYQITLRTHRDWPLQKVKIRCEPDNEEYLMAMQCQRAQGDWLYWQGLLPMSSHQDCTLYAFKLIGDKGQYWLDAVGMSRFMPGQERHFRVHRQPMTPSWLHQQVFYQIFPDRFCNGDATLDVKEAEWRVRGNPVRPKQWGDPVLAEEGDYAFYGGDLAGVQQKLDYLQQLGVTALYLNPIFKAPSNHKYDCTDYFQVDPHLGSNVQFADLCADIHQRGMRVMLDAVLNHVSLEHPWFDRHDQHDEAGAYQGAHSAYFNYFSFKVEGEPDSYVAWKGFKTLPVLDFAAPDVQQTIYAAEDSVVRYWLKAPYHIDGWRLDVIHMLGEGEGAVNNHQHVAGIAQAILQQNPNAYVLGEHFYEATAWLQGDQEQGAMNYYGFAHPMRAFFAGQDIVYHPIQISAVELAQWLAQTRAKLPFHIQLNQFNLLDSHDTARFFSLVDEDVARMQMAIVIQFCYLGVPSIFYGDEIGLTGLNDPFCRACFNWDETQWCRALWQHYQACITLRKQYVALQQGAYLDLYADEDVFVFARYLDGVAVVCAVNRGDAAQISLPIWKLAVTDFTIQQALVSDGVDLNEQGELSMPQQGHAILILQS